MLWHDPTSEETQARSGRFLWRSGMAAHYDPRKVLRQVSNQLLDELFNRKLKLHVDVEWDKIPSAPS